MDRYAGIEFVHGLWRPDVCVCIHVRHECVRNSIKSGTLRTRLAQWLRRMQEALGIARKIGLAKKKLGAGPLGFSLAVRVCGVQFFAKK